MSSKSKKVDTIGKWSEDKLDLLEDYLSAYSVIMNKQKKEDGWLRKYHYIDAFAGSGKPKSRTDEEKYIEGSPMRALNSEPKFDRYWFIEIEPWRVAKLNSLKLQYPDLEITILEGECNVLLSTEIASRIKYQFFERGLVFLDPFGLQVELETVTILAETRALDVFINFPLMGITRQLKRNEMPGGITKKLLNKIFGNTDWFDLLYKLSPQHTLFGERQIERDTITAEWLARLYSNQVKAFFPYVSKPVIMKNSKNSPLYALFLFSHNEEGVGIANKIFKRFEKLR